MFVNIVLGLAIFSYAGWAIASHIKRSKKGKCAACELKESCHSECTLSFESSKINPKKSSY